MNRIVGIYGYSFSRNFSAGGVDFFPFFGYPECLERAKDPGAFQLTGYGRFATPSEDERKDASTADVIAAGMTFIQRQHVLAGRLVDISPGDSIDSFVQTEVFRRSIRSANRRHTFGECILGDAFCPDSRRIFLQTFYERFEAERSNDPLRQAFFRYIEIFKLSTPFVEIHHFLTFSALELLARSKGSYEEQRNSAVPITAMLNDLGFPAPQIEVERWARARNKLFHNGQLSCPDPQGGPDINLIDQLDGITAVLCDVLLKELPFDDAHINWNRWRDRIAFR
jgi:hypothetical protein